MLTAVPMKAVPPLMVRSPGMTTPVPFRFRVPWSTIVPPV